MMPHDEQYLLRRMLPDGWNATPVRDARRMLPVGWPKAGYPDGILVDVDLVAISDHSGTIVMKTNATTARAALERLHAKTTPRSAGGQDTPAGRPAGAVGASGRPEARAAAMITHVDLRLLSEETRQHVLGEYRAALRQEHVRMTYAEAAWVYGYAYATMRWLVCAKKVRTVGRAPRRRITHAAMRAHLAAKKKTGCPRKALAQGQLTID